MGFTGEYTRLGEIVERVKVVIVLLVVQAALAGVIVFYKLAVIERMSMRVLIAYRFIFATASVAPLAFIFERDGKANLTWKVTFLGVLSGLFGVLLYINVLGSVIIVIGIYVVLWGKAKEKKNRPALLAAATERPAEPETVDLVIQHTHIRATQSHPS